MSKTMETLFNKKNWSAKDAFLLLELNEDPNSKNSDGEPLIHLLLEKYLDRNSGPVCFADIIYLIEKYKVDVKTTNSKGQTVLQVGLNHPLCDSSEAMKLIKLGADPNTKNNHGQSLIHLVVTGLSIKKNKAREADLALIRDLVKIHRVDVNGTNEQGLSPLQTLVQSDNFLTDDAQFLVDLGADFEVPLHNGQPLIHILLNYDAQGTLEHNRLAVLDLLKKSKQGLGGKNAAGLTVLEDYLNTSNVLSIETLNSLFQFGADPNTKNSKGETVLHLLGKRSSNRSETLKNWIEINKIDESIRNNKGETALMAALNAFIEEHGNILNVEALMTPNAVFIESITDPREVSKLNRLMSRLYNFTGYTKSYELQGKIREAAFEKLKDEIEDLNPQEQIEKLQWARKQPIFCKHRSHWFIASRGRTNTVTLIDKMIAACEHSHAQPNIQA